MAKSVKRLSGSDMKKMSPATLKNIASTAKPAKHWSLGLLDSINDPELKVEEDEQIVVIKDKYPKAQYHYLVLPKKDISAISKVTVEDLKLLDYMESIGKKLVNRHNPCEFKIGYHAIPSMHRLHLHVISTDFDSPCLKTKQHWNSFNTPYFLPSDVVRMQLKERGEIKVNTKEQEQHLKKDLKCHKCSYTPKNMPDLKRHIIGHISTR